MENKNTSKLYLHVLFVCGIQVVIFCFSLLFVVGIVNNLFSYDLITEGSMKYVYEIASFIVGIVSTLVPILLLAKKNEERLKVFVILILLLQIIIFIMVYYSLIDFANRIIDAMRSEEYIKELYYDEYAYKAILFRVNYDTFKEEFVKAIASYETILKEIMVIISRLYSLGSIVGIVVSTIISRVRIKRKNIAS